ncbi:MAG: nuclear transport factor 2 family protein, partial [Casimicrobiaceae bacterium]
MHPNATLLTNFYTAFAARDGDAMASAYTSDAQFSDPVFTDLKGAEVGSMWKMLCSRATDLRVEARDISADNLEGKAHWEAWYTFTKTGRPVHNVIDATFEFRDGK